MSYIPTCIDCTTSSIVFRDSDRVRGRQQPWGLGSETHTHVQQRQTRSASRTRHLCVQATARGTCTRPPHRDTVWGLDLLWPVALSSCGYLGHSGPESQESRDRCARAQRRQPSRHTRTLQGKCPDHCSVRDEANADGTPPMAWRSQHGCKAFSRNTPPHGVEVCLARQRHPIRPLRCWLLAGTWGSWAGATMARVYVRW